MYESGEALGRHASIWWGLSAEHLLHKLCFELWAGAQASVFQQALMRGSRVGASPDLSEREDCFLLKQTTDVVCDSTSIEPVPAVVIHWQPFHAAPQMGA